MRAKLGKMFRHSGLKLWNGDEIFITGTWRLCRRELALRHKTLLGRQAWVESGRNYNGSNEDDCKKSYKKITFNDNKTSPTRYDLKKRTVAVVLIRNSLLNKRKHLRIILTVKLFSRAIHISKTLSHGLRFTCKTLTKRKKLKRQKLSKNYKIRLKYCANKEDSESYLKKYKAQYLHYKKLKKSHVCYSSFLGRFKQKCIPVKFINEHISTRQSFLLRESVIF